MVLVLVLAFSVSCSQTDDVAATERDDVVVVGDRILVDHAQFSGRVLVEVDARRSLEIRPFDRPGVEFELHEANVVAVHSNRDLTGVEPGKPMQFYTGRPDFGNLLDGLDDDEQVFLLVREAQEFDAERSIELYGSHLQVIYAFTVDAGQLVAVPRGSWLDTGIVDSLEAAAARAETAGILTQGTETLGARVGNLLDAYNDPESPLRSELTGAD